MSRDIVVRRFDVHAPDPGVRAAAVALQEAEKRLPRGSVKLQIEQNVRPSMLTVRLVGTAAATAIVRNSVSGIRDLRVHRDWLDVPAAADGVGGARDIYPDRRALARIDPERRSRAQSDSGGARVIVAVIDSGIVTDHPDLSGHLWTEKIDGKQVHGARFMNDAHDFDVTDQDGHGTMLAGTILATADFAAGVQIMAVKFFDVTTQPTAASAARGIRFALRHGARIINLSFDLGIGSIELQEAIASACDKGALVIIAAGNTGGNNDDYPTIPAAYVDEGRDQILVVMATDWYDEKPTFSNFGAARVDLAAPGVAIASTRAPVSYGGTGRAYGRYTGTSPAAAQVTGAAALLKSQRPARTASQLKRCLVESVDPLPQLKCVSRGRLNLSRALSSWEREGPD